MTETEDVVIVAAARTAVGRLMGSLSSLPASDLGAHVIRALLDRTDVAPGEVSEVIMGQALTAGCGQNPARQTAIKAGLPETVPAMTVGMVCGAGQKSLHLATQAIRCGDAEIVVAGGQDNMSRAPFVLDGVREGVRSGEARLVDTMIKDGLWDAFHQIHMGDTAEVLAGRYQITRVEQDDFALASQRKAALAAASGHFEKEIVPINITSGEGHTVFAADEQMRPSITPAALAALKPAFKDDGTVTAGNSSGLNDGAAAVLMMSAAKAHKLGLTPLVRIVSYASAGVDPMVMGLGPIPASRRALGKAGWTAGSLDLLEVNEAFAVQSLAVNREMGWNTERVNVNGGAIAIGHPLAATGSRIVVTLVHEMVRRDVHRGLATMCIGGGLGVALCIER